MITPLLDCWRHAQGENLVIRPDCDIVRELRHPADPRYSTKNLQQDITSEAQLLAGVFPVDGPLNPEYFNNWPRNKKTCHQIPEHDLGLRAVLWLVSAPGPQYANCGYCGREAAKQNEDDSKRSAVNYIPVVGGIRHAVGANDIHEKHDK